MTTAVRATSAWSLRRRVTLVLVVSAVVTAMVVATAVALIVAVRNEQSRVINRYFDAVTVSNQLFTEVVDAETAVRGYALTGETTTLQPFTETTSAQTTAQVTRLRTLLANDPAVNAALTTAAESAGRWYEQWAIPTIAEVKAEGPGKVTTAEVLRGEQLFDTIRADFGKYNNLLSERRHSASNTLIGRTDLLLITVIIAAVALLAAAAALWVALRRWVLRPLDELGVASRTVAEGALEHQLRVTGPAELVRLGTDVEAMRQQLVGQLLEVEQARRQVQESSDAISRQSMELQRSNRDLEQFAYVASHDLQEPLRKVASFCQMLESRYKGQLDERADQYIAFAVDGAKRMQQLINDLLDFSRVGRLSTPSARVDLQHCLDRALANLEARATAAGAVITADPLPAVKGTEELLVQLFQNLIGNAIKFRRDGAPPHIHIGAHLSDEMWEFSCADNGIGIEPQYAERVFVIFQRLHTRESYEGTGIGLAMCKKIVEYHGGDIWLDETVTSGATIRWTLRHAAAEAAPALDAPELDAPDLDAPELDAPIAEPRTSRAPTPEKMMP